MMQDESIASPAESLEYLIASLLIDAYKDRDMAAFKVDRSKCGNNEQDMLKIVDDFFDVMCEVNPKHKKTVVYEKSMKALYMDILKVLYGYIESPLRWH